MRPGLIYILLAFFMSGVGNTAVAQQKSYKKQIAEHRKSYKEDLLTKERSPLDEKGIKKLKFFKADPKLKVTANFNRTPYAEPFQMALYSGLTRTYVQYGTAYFKINGKEHALAIYQNKELEGNEKYINYLFLPFKDATNDGSSYGGGRYLNLSIKDIKNNKLVIDFNKAYNPWCAYSDGYNCPIPPMVNHLEIPIEAGEKMYKGK